MKVLAIVPARAGSKRLPGKNTRLFGGRPLVTWALEAALGAKSPSRVIVSSDDPAVLAIASAYGQDIPLQRPPEFATDTSPAIQYVRHALDAVERGSFGRFDAVAIVQPTSPLTLPADIDGTVALLEASGADTAVSVVRLDHAIHPVKLKTMDGDRLLPYLEDEGGRMADHELPTLYVRNCSVYVTRRSIVDDGRIVGDDCRGYVMPRERSVDINDESDFAIAEFLMLRGLTTAPGHPPGANVEDRTRG